MKFKIEYDFSEKEFIKYAEVIDHLLGRVIDVNVERIKRSVHRFGHKVESVVEDIDDLDSDPIQFPHEVVEEPVEQELKTRFPEPPLTPHQELGKFQLTKLLDEWLLNFDTDVHPQPDRSELLLQLGNDGKLAGAVVSYCMQVGGLTKAVWNVMQEEFERGALGEEQMDIEYVRKVAAHICQIASIHLHALADQFEYPNPLTQLDV